MIGKLPNSLLAEIESNFGLERYLKSLLVGRDMTPRSWLYEQIDPDQVLERWIDVLNSLQDGPSLEREVFQFDTLQMSKWGPQGGVAPISELSEILEAGFTSGEPPRPKFFDSDVWARAKDKALTKLRSAGISSLRPASYQAVVDDMRVRDTLESNSGWPMFKRRSLPEVKAQAIAAAESGAWRDYPAIALFRNYNQKTRLVWMFPMAANLVEGSFTQPLQSLLVRRATSSLQFFAPWKGFESVRNLITRAYNASGFLSSSDFTATDSHFTIHSSREVVDVIANVFQAQYRDALLESVEKMHTIPLLTGPDSIMVGHHGVASGSNWTNLIETLFDFIFSFCVEELTGVVGLYAIGDDMTWTSDAYVPTFADDLERIGLDVGQVIQAAKTTNLPDQVTSLQRLFQRGYSRPDGEIRGVYPTIRALKSSVYPERFHNPRFWSSDMFCARQFMILENCVDHPLFEEFVRFVVKGQKDLIPFAKKPRSAIDRIHRESKLLPGLNPTYNQERRDASLGSFASIEIASKL